MKQEIKVCDDCRIPLIWTFKWRGFEYYCINCGGHWGMLGAGENVGLTPELKKQNKVIKRVWKTLAHHLLGDGGYTRIKCKKCLVDRYHHDHLTKSEIRKDRLAMSMLKKLRGAWN